MPPLSVVWKMPINMEIRDENDVDCEYVRQTWNTMLKNTDLRDFNDAPSNIIHFQGSSR